MDDRDRRIARAAVIGSADCVTPERVIVAHPFNPPHLVPLVEIVAGDAATAARASTCYRGLGRCPVVRRRELPGHIANRLASALYRGAVNLVAEDGAEPDLSGQPATQCGDRSGVAQHHQQRTS